MSSTEKKRTHVGPYEIGKKLGEGTFGKVKLGRNIFTNEKVAIKILKYKKVKTAAEKKLVEREKAVLALLNHPNIVKLIKLVDDVERGCCYMVIEYVSGGELFDYIVAHGRLREKDARKFIRQMISALEYCHAHLIVHRDLKPENLLLDDNLDIKITDFGLSNIMSPGKKFSTFCGSLHYACPEILRGEEYVGPGADIWAMGVILYCLVTGSQPWSAPTSEDILQQILLEGLQIPAWLTPECTDLIVQMLRLKEKDRITLSEMRKHPWVMKDYAEPPPSCLPEVKPVETIDEFVMEQIRQIGFQDTPEEREQIKNGDSTQVVATYHLLLKKRLEELEAERKKKQAEEEAHQRLAEAVAAANAQLAATSLSRKPSALPESIGRARANSTFVQPYLEGVESLEPSSPHGRERSGSEPPAFSEEALVQQAIACAEAEDELQAMLSNSPSTKSKKSTSGSSSSGSGRIRVKGSSTSSSTSSSGVSPSKPRPVPSLALGPVQEEDETVVKKKKEKKKTKVITPRSGPASPSSSPQRALAPAVMSSDDESAGFDAESPSSAAVPSSKSTKRPVLKLEDIPKIREAQGEKPKVKQHHPMVSPRRRAHQVEKKSVQDVFSNESSPSSSVDGSSKSKTQVEQPASEVNAALFGCSTTSTLSLPDIHKRILTVLEDMKGVTIKSSTSTTFRCAYTDVSFKIEIVSIAKFDHLRGIKLSRVTGDLWKYKEIGGKIVSKLKL